MADHPGLRYASLCAGYGGIDLGLRLAVPGSRCCLYVEREAYACALLAARMREGLLDEAPCWSDISTFDGEPWSGRLDLVAASIPCQGNSRAGKRLCEHDERNLWPDTRRILRQVRPDYFFLENVRDILAPQRAKGFAAPVARILGELAEDGWDAQWDVFSAADCGASHLRERFFLLAGRPEALGDADRARLAGRGLLDGGRADRGPAREAGLPIFPPGPGDVDAWGPILRERPGLAPAVALKSFVQRVVDGIAPRVDRLRAVGNGVVPAVVARAWSVLFDRLTGAAPCKSSSA